MENEIKEAVPKEDPIGEPTEAPKEAPSGESTEARKEVPPEEPKPAPKELPKEPPKLQVRLETKLAQANNRDLIFMLLYFAYSVMAVDFALISHMHMGYFISTLAFAVLSVCYLKDRKFTLLPMFCLVAAVAGSAVFMLYTDSITLFWLFVGINLLLVTFLCLTGDISRYGVSNYRFVGDVTRTGVFVLLGEVANSFRSVFALDRKGKKANVGAIIIGIVCALPVLLLVVPLLVSADAAFESLMNQLMNSISRLLLDLFLGAILFPFVFSICFSSNKQVRRYKPYVPKAEKGISYYGASAFLGAISLVYVVYLLSQLSYLSNGFLGILPKDFTYAEYARRGFFEMITICVINLGLIFGVIALSKKKKDQRQPLIQKILVLFICLFSVALIACDFAKMVMYIDAYGMTQMRIYTSVFMIMLAVVFLVGIIRLFWSKMPYMQALIVLITLVGLTVAFTDVDTVISTYNYNAYTSGQLPSIDVSAYRMLSDSAVPQLIDLMKDNNQEVSEKARGQLETRFRSYYREVDGQWVTREKLDFRDFNMNQQRAMGLLYENREAILQT